MNIVSINMIIEVNRLLKDEEIPYQVHLRDACGRQSMWLEVKDDNTDTQKSERVYDLINKYFEKQHMVMEYSEDKMTFWVARG